MPLVFRLIRSGHWRALSSTVTRAPVDFDRTNTRYEVISRNAGLLRFEIDVRPDAV